MAEQDKKQREAQMLSDLAKVQDALVLNKSATNPHYKSRYVKLPDLLESVRPVLREHGFVDTFQIHTSDGVSDSLDRITATMTFTHLETHEALAHTATMPVAKADPQGWGGGITYMRRYMMTSLIGLIEDDDDGNSASNRQPQQDAKQSAKPAKPAATISETQRVQLEDMLREASEQDRQWFYSALKQGGVERLADMQANRFEKAKAALSKRTQKGGK